MPLRSDFRRCYTAEGRTEIASAELAAWTGYLASRKEQIAAEMPEWQMDPKTKSLLKEQFDRLKRLETMGVPGPELIDFHGAFAKKFHFNVPIHPRNLAHLIHPFQGYMAAMPKHFLFDDLVQVYENQIVASLERSTGRDLLSDELSCLSLWLAHSDKSSLTWAEMKPLLASFRFEIATEEDFQQEFESLLPSCREPELNYKKKEANIYRFDLARSIFLERGL